MLFNSVDFIFLFLPVALLGYYCLGHFQHRAAAAWLCVTSLVFYGWWNPPFVILLVCSIVFNYFISRALLATSETPRRQGLVLFCGVTANILALLYFKYLFSLLAFAKSLAILNTDYGNVILPLGISFFTFTQIGYLIDVKAELAKERSFLNYCLFVVFFPHLIAGPIMHHKEMMPQFAESETYKFRVENISIGLTFFVIGLAKKVLLADRIAPWAESGFATPGDLGLFASWGAVLTYSLQLYFDFSGYSDMAIGLAKMFGVRFPLNFDSPYKSRSIIGFWQSWHMTLTRYLNLYLYNPMALAITRLRMAKGLSAGKAATSTLEGFASLVITPTLLTMVLAGVWHGAGLQFLIFGLLHALYLVINHGWRIFGPKLDTQSGRLITAVTYGSNVLLTYFAVLLAQIFFRSDSTSDAFTMISGLLGVHGVENLQWTFDQSSATAKQPLVLACLFGIVWLFPNAHQIMGKYSPALAKPHPMVSRLFSWQPSIVWGIVTAAILFLCVVMLQNTAKFLYFQF
jgi:alginate O-acetyltransferase complex protein AlgI